LQTHSSNIMHSFDISITRRNECTK
jgi:hypothetical protein